jgi:O-antigen/teichoic acid export membrane protein
MNASPSGARDSLGRRMARGAGWMILLRAVDRAIGVVSISILARLLLPEDFGLVALAVSVVAIVEAFGALSVEAALIRNYDSGRTQYDSAWTIRAAASCALALVLLAAAEPAAAFFRDPRVAAILYVLAATTAIAGFENIGTVEFQKELEFRRDFTYQFTTRIAATAVTILAAIVLRDYWALVIGMACRSVFRVAMSYAVHPYRPRFSTEHVRPLFKFSKWLLAQNVIGGVNTRLSNIILGRLTAVDLVAYFTVGSEIARLATSEIQAPIRRAIYPGFAKVAADLGHLRQTFLGSFAMMTLLALPIAVGIGLVADYAVHLLLGPRWLPAIPIVQIIALAGAIQSLRTGSHLVYLAIGRPQLALILGLLSFTITLPLLIVGIEMAGIIGAAWATVAAGTVLIFADYALLARYLRVTPSDFVAALWRPVIAAALMASCVLALRTALPLVEGWTEALLGLAVCAPLGAAVYVGAVFLFWRWAHRPDGAEQAILATLRRG